MEKCAWGAAADSRSDSSSFVDHLADERRSAAFNVNELTDLLYGGKERAERMKWVADLVASDPVFKKDAISLGRREAMRRSFQKVLHSTKRIKELHLKDDEIAFFRLFVDDINFSDLHLFMFIPAIEGQAAEEQIAEWLPRAMRYEWIGCYAQTELGHGSNVQRLETTATFSRDSDSFILHSPTLTSTKWWPGGLGKASTHAVVYARLILDKKDYGIHAFLVQLRCLETHIPLPGIKVGDIGPKFGNGGYNTMDNGFLRFANVSIPRTNMLMRYARVTEDGQFERPKGVVRQLAYGTMVWVRRGIVLEAGIHLSRAVTIAARYSCVRRQFGGGEKDVETKVIEYPTQSRKVLVLLSTAFAFRFTAMWLKDLYDQVMASIRQGDFSTLPEVHAATAGLKAYTTSVTADGIEECRKLCGGHGYSCASGLPQLYASYVPACTYEGDNTVLLLQTARYLVKAVGQAAKGTAPTGTASYLGNILLSSSSCPAHSEDDFLDISKLIEALKVRSFRLVVRAAQQVVAASSPEQGFRESGVEMVKAAVAHCQLITLIRFYEAISSPSLTLSPSLSAILFCLCHIFGLSLVEEASADLLECEFFSPAHPPLVRTALVAQVKEARKQVVPLVDSFAFTDHYLGSSLGQFNGDVYNSLFNAAINDPLNKSDVPLGYEEFIKPLQQLGYGPQAKL